MITTVTDTPDAKPAAENAGTTSSLKENSLKAAGWSYLVGDAALVTAGILEGDKKTAIAGALYGTGGLVLARYGNPKTEKRLQLLYQDLGDYLKAKGVKIPKGSKVDAAMLAKDGGIIEHIENFLYKYPSQVLNTLFTVGGLQLMHGGITNNRPWKTASGALVTAGALAGLLIREKHSDEQDETPAGFFDKALRWVQDKPLRASGYLYMANNVTMTIDAIQERNKMRAKDLNQLSKKSSGYLFQLLMVASYVIANGLLAISNKNNTASENIDKERTSIEELERAAAEVIASQPKEIQHVLIKQVANYLSIKGRSNISSEELASAMQEKIKGYGLIANEWQQRVEKGAEPQLLPSL